MSLLQSSARNLLAVEKAEDGKAAAGPTANGHVEGLQQQQEPLADDSSVEGKTTSSNNSSGRMLHWFWSPTTVATALIVTLGCASSGVFVYIGVSGAIARQKDFFERDAADFGQQIVSVVADYVGVASLVHNRCRDRNFSRQDFRNLYEYVVNGGGESSLDFKAVQFDPFVNASDRAAFEEEARLFYNESYPHIEYRGFVGFETEIPSHLEPRSEQEFYYPIHYMEPIIGNEAAIDLDYFSHISRRRTLQYCMDHGLPAITDRLVLVKDPDSVSRCGAIDPAYGVVLMHPGVNLTLQADVWPHDLSSIVICIPSLLGTAAENHGVSSAVYIYDSSGEDNVYLGGVSVDVHQGGLEPPELTFLPEVTIDHLQKSRLWQQSEVTLTNKEWTFVVVASSGSYEPELTFVILGGVVIFLASICLGMWVLNSTHRMRKFARMKAEADTEKAMLILENARQATRAERELNDFVAHEVRNPVSAAMSACSFVKAAVNKKDPLKDEEAQAVTREDVNIIDTALTFVSDLLRNMLDMHRASSKQLVVNMVPTDILLDIMEPVGGMLYRRGDRVKVIIDCPPDMFVTTDSLRLKQVMLNLGRNSSKFISEGFIRLGAKEVDGLIQLSVEDSGSGVPEEKRKKLFSKFQDSLDVLSQGTGIGLFLCKNLVELLGGKIYLDEEYDSGIPGCRGSRFVVDLMVPRCERAAQSNRELLPESGTEDGGPKTTSTSTTSDSLETANPELELPKAMSVLFVDDDGMLRKLFARSIKRTAPDWTCREAASGETALRLVETESFDVIFMDQYMASVEKQLLGTEAVVELRARGVDCIICGLSANDKEIEFLDAGADAFVMKPFPCKPEMLKRELLRITSCAANKKRLLQTPSQSG